VKLLKLFVLILLGLVCYFPSTAQLYFPPTDGSEWETLSPAELNWCNDSLNSLYQYLESVDTKAFMVLKDGKIVLEKYFNEFGPDSFWYWASAGKSLRSVLLGIAIRERSLNMEDLTSKHIDTGWTSCCIEKENLIKVKHQMSMTSGLNDEVDDPFCTVDSCLDYLVNAGSRWAYHNAPYSLLKEVLENSTGETLNRYTRTRIQQLTGMNGFWLTTGFNTLYYSNARSMARFGLLALDQGDWGIQPVLADTNYFKLTVNSSQNINPSYGYLWWLNGKSTHMIPGTQIRFNGPLVPEAPSDMFAAMGANEQRIYVVPSTNMVVIRMGNATGQQQLAVSSFDNKLWEKINGLNCALGTREVQNSDIKIFPNPTNKTLHISISQRPDRYEIDGFLYNSIGQVTLSFNTPNVDVSLLPAGVYFAEISIGGHSITKRILIE